MQKLIIQGGTALNGTVEVSGAKNASLPLLAASLLTEEAIEFTNVPDLADIGSMISLLEQHGAGVDRSVEGTVTVEARKINNFTAPYEIVRTMRASIWVLAPLLARFGKAKVSLPGGCAIGTRPIDLHLDGLRQMGAKIDLKGGYVEASSRRLQGAEITFPKVSVGATASILMAATLAKGKTTIYNAAREPEISDLARCLSHMGAEIYGIGTSTLRIIGVSKLKGTKHRVIPDRIETASFIIAAALTRGEITLKNAQLDMLGDVMDKLSAAGVCVSEVEGGIKAKLITDSIKAVDITTAEYPGFPTDMQAQFITLMTMAEGESRVTETIFENRFMHVPELVRMGADAYVDGNTAVVRGVPALRGAEVMATDLRASFSLVIAALAAKGESIINRVYHIDRGYEKIARKLSDCGAKIERVGE